MMLQNDLTHWMEAPNSSSRRTNITPVQLLGLDVVEVQTGRPDWGGLLVSRGRTVAAVVKAAEVGPADRSSGTLDF